MAQQELWQRDIETNPAAAWIFVSRETLPGVFTPGERISHRDFMSTPNLTEGGVANWRTILNIGDGGGATYSFSNGVVESNGAVTLGGMMTGLVHIQTEGNSFELSGTGQLYLEFDDEIVNHVEFMVRHSRVSFHRNNKGITIDDDITLTEHPIYTALKYLASNDALNATDNSVYHTNINTANLPVGINKDGILESYNYADNSDLLLIYKTFDNGALVKWINHNSASTWTGWSQVGDDSFVFSDGIINNNGSIKLGGQLSADVNINTFGNVFAIGGNGEFYVNIDDGVGQNSTASFTNGSMTFDVNNAGSNTEFGMDGTLIWAGCEGSGFGIFPGGFQINMAAGNFMEYESGVTGGIVGNNSIPSVGWINNQIDNKVAGLLDYRGAYDASVNSYPTTGGSGTAGALLTGDLFVISNPGTLDGIDIHIGDYLIANSDTPGQASANWDKLNTNISYVPEDVANKENTTLDISITKYPTNRLVKEYVDANAGGGSTTQLPSLRGDDWIQADVVAYLQKRHDENGDCGTPLVTDYGYNSNSGSLAFAGGVYSPGQNRIYLVPYGQADTNIWSFLDCDTGKIEVFANNTTAFDNGYFGGVYSPVQNRIYFIPFAQSNQTNWHYIDCSNGNVVAYTNGVTAVANAYKGGVYSPVQNRIYLIPNAQSNQTNWHYIDCSNGNVVAYAHGITAVAGAYNGGVYSPVQNRIYFVPNAQSDQTNWHYIDCSNGNVVAYTNGVTAVANAYNGGVYSPVQNRIYFVPNAQSNQTNWHYIDCSNGNVVAFAHGITAMANAYKGGVYSPVQNRIYFVPYAQSDQTNWHYIDCSSGNVLTYAHGVTAVANAYIGGVYSPISNRIYFIPYTQSSLLLHHYIQHSEEANVSPRLMSYACFNKY